MSKYTTGELAKLCGITVRTVQYYDSQNLLHPSELSEGGRRLYDDDNLRKMQTICMLRGLGLPLDTIKKIYREENAGKIVRVLLQEHLQRLQAEISERQEQSGRIAQLLQWAKAVDNFFPCTITDIANSMEKRKKLRKTYAIMLIIGVLMSLAQIITILLWVLYGRWLPFAIAIPIVLLCGVWLTRLYYKNSAYLCPECGATFKPGIWKFLFSAHTPKTRKLTCGSCGHKGFCIETYAENQTK